jgi:hypothetical protein
MRFGLYVQPAPVTVAPLVSAALGAVRAQPGEHVQRLGAHVLAALPLGAAGEVTAEADLGFAGGLDPDPLGLVICLVELGLERAVEVLVAGAARPGTLGAT